MTMMTGRQALIPLITNSLNDRIWEKQHPTSIGKSILHEEEEKEGNQMTRIFRDHDHHHEEEEKDGRQKKLQVPSRNIVGSESSPPSIVPSSLLNFECSSCLEKERELRDLSSQLNRMKINLVQAEADLLNWTNESIRTRWENQEHHRDYQMTDDRLIELGHKVSCLQDQSCRLVGFLTGSVCEKRMGWKR